MNIGILGTGTVGSATADGLEAVGHTIARRDPAKGHNDDLEDCAVIFVCIYDVHFLEEVISELPEVVIAVRTTSPPGTTDGLIERFGSRVVYNPEFLCERSAASDFLSPDKVVIGASGSASEVVASVYADFKAPVITMSPVEAEILKLSLNVFYAVKVTFMNEVADLCELYGGKYSNVREGFELDRFVTCEHLDVMRDGYRGFGGKCLPKDTDLFIQAAHRLGVPVPMAQAAKNMNEWRRRCSGL